MIGETIKDFKIVERLGKGGMGEVWIGEQQIVKTRVAIKLLVQHDEAQVQRFFNEAVAADRIHHAGIVKIFDVGFFGERPYLIMELLDGESLAARAKRGRLPMVEVIDIARQLASVLAAVHAAGITHRDLKPDNIILVPDGELASKRRVKVLDFGIAKLAVAGTGPVTATSSSMGTPAYMAPEQWKDAASADARADLYALGCLVFELCAGRPPFVAATIGEACTKHLTEAPPRVRTLAPNVAVELDAILDRMLAKDPAQRPAIAEIAQVLATIPDDGDALAATHATTGALDATQASTPPRVPTTLRGAAGAVTTKPQQRRWLAPVAIVGCVAIVGGAVAVATLTHDPDAPTPAPVSALAFPHAIADAPPPARDPSLGLAQLANLREPTSATSASLRSESAWLATRDDFADGCKRPDAPVRWCAAVDLADGELAMIHDKPADAVDAFGRAAKRDPAWAEPLVLLAAAHAYRDEFDASLEAARTAQRVEPTWWQTVAAGARTYSVQQKFTTAITEYRRALALAPASPALLAEVALIYHAAGFDTESETYAAKALAADPGLASIHLMRAERALEKRDGKTALAEVDHALAISPSDAPAHLARGDALALLGDKAGALAEYQITVDAIGDRATRAPDARLAAIKVALANHTLPPPRTPMHQSLDTTQRVRPVNPANDRPRRTRPGCAKGDPLCGSLDDMN